MSARIARSTTASWWPAARARSMSARAVGDHYVVGRLHIPRIPGSSDQRLGDAMTACPRARPMGTTVVRGCPHELHGQARLCRVNRTDAARTPITGKVMRSNSARVRARARARAHTCPNLDDHKGWSQRRPPRRRPRPAAMSRRADGAVWYHFLQHACVRARTPP